MSPAEGKMLSAAAPPGCPCQKPSGRVQARWRAVLEKGLIPSPPVPSYQSETSQEKSQSVPWLRQPAGSQ